MSETILCVNEAATRKLGSMKEAGRFDDSALRVAVREEGATFHYELEVVDQKSRADGDAVVEAADIQLFVDPESAALLRGATLEYVEEVSGGGFRFDNPNKPKLLENPLAERVQHVLDQRINPSLASHGGRASLIDVQEDRVFIRMSGGCQGCGQADLTLREGITATLQHEIPEIGEILDVTDHAAGTNPYYEAGR